MKDKHDVVCCKGRQVKTEAKFISMRRFASIVCDTDPYCECRICLTIYTYPRKSWKYYRKHQWREK